MTGFTDSEGYDGYMSRWSRRLATGFLEFNRGPFEAGATPTTRYASSLPEAHRLALRDRLRADLLGEGPDRPFGLSARAWAVRGIVPAA